MLMFMVMCMVMRMFVLVRMSVLMSMFVLVRMFGLIFMSFYMLMILAAGFVIMVMRMYFVMCMSATLPMHGGVVNFFLLAMKLHSIVRSGDSHLLYGIRADHNTGNPGLIHSPKECLTVRKQFKESRGEHITGSAHVAVKVKNFTHKMYS